MTFVEQSPSEDYEVIAVLEADSSASPEDIKAKACEIDGTYLVREPALSQQLTGG